MVRGRAARSGFMHIGNHLLAIDAVTISAALHMQRIFRGKTGRREYRRLKFLRAPPEPKVTKGWAKFRRGSTGMHSYRSRINSLASPGAPVHRRHSTGAAGAEPAASELHRALSLSPRGGRAGPVAPSDHGGSFERLPC